VTNAHDEIGGAFADAERLRKALSKNKSNQVRNAEELDLIKANVSTWFKTRRPAVTAALGETALKEVDNLYRALMAATNKASTRANYFALIKCLKAALSTLGVENVVELSRPAPTSDHPPSFNSITSDADMQRIMANRWVECVGCVSSGYPLAAIVMMGGILEALLIAKINQLSDQSPVFKAKAAPKDKKTGAPFKLRDWALSDYIDVAHEMKWISETYKDIGVILRDYRNYIHPYKEYQHKKQIVPDDAKALWEISKTIARQLLKP